MTIYQCDRCGAQFKNTDTLKVVGILHYRSNGIPTEEHDLCEFCISALRGFLKPLPTLVKAPQRPSQS